MATFISRGRFSREAIKGLVSKPEDREQIVRKLVEAAGGKLVSYYVTTGDSDFLIITEGDSTENLIATLLVAAAAGTVTDVTTSQAWTAKQFKAVAEKAGSIMASYRAPGQSQ